MFHVKQSRRKENLYGRSFRDYSDWPIKACLFPLIPFLMQARLPGEITDLPGYVNIVSRAFNQERRRQQTPPTSLRRGTSGACYCKGLYQQDLTQNVRLLTTVFTIYSMSDSKQTQFIQCTNFNPVISLNLHIQTLRKLEIFKQKEV